MQDQIEIVCPWCLGVCMVPKLEDACVFFHECECCGVLLRPKAGDCCVVCSYGDGGCAPKAADPRSASA